MSSQSYLTERYDIMKSRDKNKRKKKQKKKNGKIWSKGRRQSDRETMRGRAREKKECRIE